jgi:hypothetical protein
MRWSLISLVAAVLPAVVLARTRSAGSPPATDLIPLTRPELPALLQAAVLRAPCRDLAHTLHWSRWRRRHQHRAATCHRRWNEITAAATTMWRVIAAGRPGPWQLPVPLPGCLANQRHAAGGEPRLSADAACSR